MRLCQLDNHQSPSIVRDPVLPASPRWTKVVVRSLICAVILASFGCGSKTDPREVSEEELQARRDELAKAFPVPPPDTPEQIREKEAKVEETLPQVYAMLEEAKSDPTKVDEVVKLSMSLLTLVPGHREAKLAYGKARLASFHAKETTDAINALIAINSAVMEMDRLRENFADLSEEELQLCQEVYFNQARREGYYPQGEDAPTTLKEAIDKLMASGFSDAERLKTEPKFQYFLNDPKTAPILQSAIEKIESSATESSSE
ncbi:MAG: hypothetical protein KDA86_17055 [Planctomycetaceae bacterium]|nr:hypothetical protein [Planctomycetaceae bacterium]